MKQVTDQKQTVQFAVAAKQVSCFGGYAKPTEFDIASTGGVVAKTSIITKGSKHIFPREKLAVFSRIKKDVERSLWKFGVKSFGSGSAIAFSLDELATAEKLLEKAKVDFGVALDELRANYDVWLNEFIMAQPTQAEQEVIRKSALSRDVACDKFHFSYDIFVPTPIGEKGSIESMAEKLVRQLYAEVAQAAEEAYDVTFAPEGSDGKRYVRRVGQRAKSGLRACRDKMEKMAFLHPGINGAVSIVNYVLSKTQDAGFIDNELGNPAATRLFNMVVLMMDADLFAATADKVFSSNTPEDDIEMACGIAVAQQQLPIAAPVTTATAVADVASVVVGAPVAEMQPAPANEVIDAKARQVEAPTVAVSAEPQSAAQAPSVRVMIVPKPVVPRAVVPQNKVGLNSEIAFF